MAYSAIAVANTIIEKANLRGISELTQMKLMKLVYFSHAAYLAIYDKPLIDEPVRAWKYGPVIPSVYDEFKKHEKLAITALGKDIIFDEDEQLFKYDSPIFDPLKNEDEIEIIDIILDSFGDKSGPQLSNITHSADSAWGVCRFEHRDGSIDNYVISNDLIKKCMKRRIGIA